MLLRHGLIVLAVAASVAGAGIAARADVDPSTATTTPAISTALPLSRRADPSTDRYTWTTHPTTPLKRMTSAQTWISNRISPFVAYDSSPNVSLNLLGWATHPNVHAYVNAAGPNAYNRDGVRDAAPYLLKVGGKQVMVDGWDVIDLRNPAARQWWLYGSDGKATCNPDLGRRAALDLIACGYTGLWVDDVLTLPAAWYKPDPKIDATQWGDAVVALLQELRAALPAGKTFTINAHWTDTTFPYAPAPSLSADSPFVRAAQTADQLVMEGGAIDPGLNYGGSVTDAWSYPRLLAYVDALHAQGVKVQWEKTDSGGLVSSDPKLFGTTPACSDQAYKRAPGWKVGGAAWKANTRASGFNLGSALLAFAPGDSVGDMCEYPGRGFRAYGQDLGQPLGDRATVGGLIVRQFTGGMVAVNPGLRAVTATLPAGRVGINLASVASRVDNRTATSFAVAPRSAAIVQFAPAAAVATTP